MSSKSKKSKESKPKPESEASSSSEDLESPPPKKQKTPEKKKKKKSAKSGVDSDNGEAASKPTAVEDMEDDHGDEDMIAIAEKRFVTIREFKGKPLIDIREYYQSDGGELKPAKKGIALNIEQWNKLKKVSERVDARIKKKF